MKPLADVGSAEGAGNHANLDMPKAAALKHGRLRVADEDPVNVPAASLHMAWSGSEAKH